jgi:hypothetical protein
MMRPKRPAKITQPKRVGGLTKGDSRESALINLGMSVEKLL